MSEWLKVYEVGPRDGLQNESAALSAAQKADLIDGLVEAGLRHIEATSFVHPRARHADNPVEFVGLVFNERGYERALAGGCRSMAFGAAVSETFSERNTHNTPRQALDIARALIDRAQADGVRTRFYVMTAWICPFEGPISPHKTLAVVQEIADWGVDEIAIADTVGHAEPLSVGRLIEMIAAASVRPKVRRARHPGVGVSQRHSCLAGRHSHLRFQRRRAGRLPVRAWRGRQSGDRRPGIPSLQGRTGDRRGLPPPVAGGLRPRAGYRPAHRRSHPPMVGEHGRPGAAAGLQLTKAVISLRKRSISAGKL